MPPDASFFKASLESLNLLKFFFWLKVCVILLQKSRLAGFLLVFEYSFWKKYRFIGRESVAMGASRGPRFSGIQKQVLALYRGFLRAARSKSPEDRRQIESFVSAEFRRNSKLVDRKNFFYIEYLLRRGKKQLEQINSPATLGLSSLNLRFSENQKP